MNFTSFEFLCFFVALILLLSCLRGLSAQKWLLLAASYCFYLTWSVPMHCVFSVYFAVGLLYRAQAGSDRESNSSKTAAYQRPCGQPGAAGILQVQ
jgi:D-alanyl-lipoteichoic acid acyltransferase DltB (MBOAT superfamily)